LSRWNNIPSRTVANGRADGATRRLLLASSCQKLQGNVAPRLILAAERLATFFKYLSSARRVCKQRLQGGLRARVPRHPSTRRFASKVHADDGIGLPAASILSQAQLLGLSTAMTAKPEVLVLRTPAEKFRVWHGEIPRLVGDHRPKEHTQSFYDKPSSPS